MKYLGKLMRTGVRAASLIVFAAITSLVVVNCGGGGYGGGGGGYMTPAPGAFHLVKPDGAAGVTTTPTFTWTASYYATSYVVEISLDAFHTLAINPAPMVMAPQVMYTVPAMTPLVPGTYSWRVRAHDAAGDMLSSETFTFST